MMKSSARIALGLMLLLSACAHKTVPGASADGGLPLNAGSPTPTAPNNTVAVTLGETDATHMFISLSYNAASAGKVTFRVTNQGKVKHEFVVLKTDTPAANFPVTSFEKTPDRFDEDLATNVGETGDMAPGETKTLVISMAAGHYAVVCNLQGHYRMGMHQDFTVASSPDTVAVILGEHGMMHMFIDLSATSAPAGKVSFIVTNQGARKHEFVVLQTNTAAGSFPVTSFENTADRFNEDLAKNVGETGDMAPGETKTLVINMAAGHYAVVCNLPGHYRMGMHQDFTVLASANAITVGLGETSATQMFIHLSATSAPAGKVSFIVTNQGARKHEFVVLQTNTAAGSFPVTSFENTADRFNEDLAKNVGETGDMAPGETKTLVINMAAGHYAVVCNLPGHYRMGMHQDFTVTSA